MPARLAPDAHAGRRVGMLVLGRAVRRGGVTRIRAVCDCGRTTLVRQGHVTPGAAKPVLSCGCLHGGGAKRCYLGASLPGGARVVHDDDARRVVLGAAGEGAVDGSGDQGEEHAPWSHGEMARAVIPWDRCRAGI